MHKNKNKINSDLIFIILFIIFICIFPLLKNKIGNKSNNIDNSSKVLVYVNNSKNFIVNSFTNITQYFYTKKYFLNKINELEKELNTEKEKNINLNLDNYNDKDIIVANKIFVDNTSVYDTILLDKGRDFGVKENDIVFVDENYAIGKIISVGEETSLLSLFSKSNENVEAYTIDNLNFLENEEEIVSHETKNKIILNLEGYGGGDFVVKVSNNLNIGIGNKFYLANNTNYFLGEVVSIDKDALSLYSTLFIKGVYNPKKYYNFFIKIK